jgi:uncharacterized protein YgiM (DUF1202 family)
MLVLLCLSAAGVSAQTSSVTAEAFRRINVRSGPAVNFPVIAQLESGDVVDVVGRSNADNDWLQVTFSGQTGWVAYFVVSVSGDLDALPIIELEAAATEAVELANSDLPQIAAVEALSATNATVTASAYRRANVRSAPNTAAAVIGQLQPGDIVTVTGRSNARGEWLQIEFNGQTGWVAFFLVSVEGALDTLPIQLEAAQTNALSTAQPVEVITRFNANLRASASLQGDIIAIIPFETVLTGDGRTRNGNWMRVTYEGETGWLLLSLVTIRNNGNIDTLPIIDN